jgi:hypothetical protein
MRFFQQLNSLLVCGKFYFVKFESFQIYSNKHQKISKNSKDFKSVLIFSLASALAEFLAILQLFAKLMLQNMSGTHAAT